jgi:serine/threonine-protein kinase ATR
VFIIYVHLSFFHVSLIKLVFSLISDLVSVASSSVSSITFSQKPRVCIKCFCEVFAQIESDVKQAFSEVPLCWRAKDGPGLLLDVTGNDRWQPLAEWTMKLLGRILSEGMLHVEGLFTSSFISSIGNLICLGDSSMQKVDLIMIVYLYTLYCSN